MDFKLKEKVAIIGGSSKGLGKACAISLAKEGVNIVLCANDTESLQKTKTEIEAFGVRVLALNVDMSAETDNEQIIEQSIKMFGRIDILINNSGGPKPGKFIDLTLQDFDNAYNSVFKYNIRMIKACLPFMEKNNWGRIINITSLSVKEPSPSLLLSNVFRAATVSLAKSISKDLIGKGITINNICPGAFKTDRAIELLQQKANNMGISFDEAEQLAVNNFPQKRYQKPEELGDLVCFLASEKASSLTGTTIQIDGGISNSLL
ncbi:MAG: hypothetical protein A2275_07310 [Bacteroidetes bacterium RIFOXYA12_FULL_35_11]|nr:MAG: hypothetical protein A2X01_06400 [Bacteroidetes bacterium GWF2_35_48]OFY73057.1 MAG: hypothetical protein A2275_07310 [Bacteroidetes bacterium RIFOXYA12_FULL_35_11]OFY93945.1 MAG: hypothetical protein A2491_11885 [Bacteroidetes bacterium RIFOXYC12_FULL_35_7]OFY97844.1 MAG: hypothetical protein A2309_01535 [Bacteroidetes bacterium RIFOXYB2_FULL_35_7]HBX53546.1 3-oxoacyl-ACP reductase [Bacteroidales bacterium]